MVGRLTEWLVLLLVAADQFVQVLASGIGFVLFGGDAPDPDETISSRVGRAALAGKAWGKVLETIIDGIFGAGHCRRSIGR